MATGGSRVLHTFDTGNARLLARDVVGVTTMTRRFPQHKVEPMDWYEHFCPKHGVVVRYRRDDVVQPAIPITCPRDVTGPNLRCGERLKLRIVPTERGPRLDGLPRVEW